MAAESLDDEFLRRVLGQTAIPRFNVKASDFEMTRFYKKEIQHLFLQYYFPDLRQSNHWPPPDALDVARINKIISHLKSAYKFQFDLLYGMQPKGIGPGEVMLYFLINKAALGGGGSAGEDVIIIGGSAYEVKAAKIARDDAYAYGFKLGGTLPIVDIMQKLGRLKTKALVLPAGKGRLDGSTSLTEISTNQIKTLSEKFPNEYDTILSAYKDVAYNAYFKKHSVIFLNNNDSTTVRGYIAAVKNVKKDDIAIQEMTSGTIKPRVLLK